MVKLFFILCFAFLIFISNSFSQSNDSGVLLYSQNSTYQGMTSLPSYKNLSSLWGQVADDFYVTSDWSIDQVVVVGDDIGIDTNSVDGFDINIYTNNNGSPGTLVFSSETQPYSILFLYYFYWKVTITLETPAELTSGNYFISVQFHSNSGSTGWHWTQVNGSYGSIAMYRSSGTGQCASWVPVGTCVPTSYTNMYFELYGTSSGTTDIEEQLTSPSTFSLEQNYPNPFNPSTKIKYSVSQSSNVVLKIFDVLGNELATLVDEETPAGSYEVEFDASKLSSGAYFYQLRAGSFVETRKMILMK